MLLYLFCLEPQRLPIKHIFCLSNGNHESLGADINLCNMIFLVSSQIGSCTLWKTQSCHEHKTLPVPISYCLSLCFVLPQSQSASPKQRKQSVFTPPALKGTVQVLSLSLEPWLCVFSHKGSSTALTGSCSAIAVLMLWSDYLELTICLILTIHLPSPQNLAAVAVWLFISEASFCNLDTFINLM